MFKIYCLLCVLVGICTANDPIVGMSLGFMGLIQPMMGLMGAMMSNSTQQDQIAAQVDIANKNRSAENARHARTNLTKSNEDLLDTQFRTNQAQQGAFQDVLGVLRDSILRSPKG